MKTRLLQFFVGSCGVLAGLAAQAQTGPAPGATWQFQGPNNLDVPNRQFFGVRPTSGRVSAVAWCRSNTNIVYAAGGGGGVWKSADGGATWAVTGSDMSPTWAFVQVDSLAVDPNNENTVYAGSGSFRNVRSDQQHPIGLLKSADGGTTWANLNVATNQVISKIVVDPDDSGVITITTYDSQAYAGQVLRSTNGGGAWYAVSPAANVTWTDATVGGRDKTGKRYYYVAGYTANGSPQVFNSTNQPAGGAVSPWSALAPPLASPPAAARFRFAAVTVSASQVNPQYVYLMSGADEAILQSTNAGANWLSITNGFPQNYDGSAPDATWEQAGYDRHIEAAWIPGTSVDVIYVGLVTIAGMAIDNITNWTDIGQTGQAAPVTHNDQQSLAFNPRNPNQVLFGNDGGLYSMLFNPRTRAWAVSAQPNATVKLTQFYGAAYDPSNPANMLGGTQDNATPRSYGANSPIDALAPNLNRWNNCTGGDGGRAAVRPVNPLVQFGTGNQALSGTTDGWATSTLLLASQPRTGFVPPFVLDGTGATSNTVYYGSITNILYLGNDYINRVAWDGTTINNDLQLGATRLTGGGNGAGPFSGRSAYVNAVALAPGDNNRLYAGSTDGTLWMTRHALATNTMVAVNWEQINAGTPALPAQGITSIAVDPYNQNRVFVGVAGSGIGLSHLYVCQDVTQLVGSRAWTPAGTNGLQDVPVNAIALDPADPTNTWYVGMDNGVFFTRNGGTAWNDATHALGLPAAQVNDLQAIPGTGMLNAATYGRGIWSLALTNGNQQIAGFGISPNPIGTNSLNLAVGRITLSKPAPPGGVSIQITNDHPSTYNLTNQFIAEGQISTFFLVLGLDHQPGTNITFTAIVGSESHNTVLQVVDPASGRALFAGHAIVASLNFDSDHNISVSFVSEAGMTYVLQYKNSLNDPEWISLAPGIPGTGGVLVLQDTSGIQPRRFYRVVGVAGQ